MNYNEETIKKILDVINLIRKGGINRELTEELIRLMSNNEKIRCEFKKKINAIAYYNTLKEKLYVSEASIINWVKKYIKQSNIENYYSNCDYNDLFIYFFVYVLNHEINHAFQHLMGKNVLKTNYQTIKTCYKELYDLCNKQKISINLERIKNSIELILFHINERQGILERNANIDAFSFMYKLADYENNHNIKELAFDTKQTIQMQGYSGKYNGAIEEAYKKILIFNKVKYDEDISLEEKVRYGYPIDEYTKKKVLNYEFEA